MTKPIPEDCLLMSKEYYSFLHLNFPRRNQSSLRRIYQRNTRSLGAKGK